MESVSFLEWALENFWRGCVYLCVRVSAEESLNSNGAMIHRGSVSSAVWWSLHGSTDLGNRSLLQRCSGKCKAHQQ